jgi:uncharacterized tellurite resistance protein B-like protein
MSSESKRASGESKRVAFIKTLVAAAWADERITPSEIRMITEYLRRFGIGKPGYEAVRALLARPLAPAEAEALVREQLAILDTREERGALVAAVGDLLLADHQLEPAEGAFLAHLRELTRHPTTPQLFVAQLQGLWQRLPQPAAEAATGDDAAAADPATARAAEGFFRQRLLEHFRRVLAVARARSGQPLEDGIADDDLYRVVIRGALLSTVALADATLVPEEEAELLRLLAADEALPEGDVRVVVEVYKAAAHEQLDLTWVVREFMRRATPEDASRLLDGLFLVGAADGDLREPELQTIREIAARMGIPAAAYHSALARCKARLERGWN